MASSIKLISLASLLLLTACGDDNSIPKYSKDSGLPINCRAYVQTAIDGYRNRQYSADDAMAGLERNCGVNGQSWSSNR